MQLIEEYNSTNSHNITVKGEYAGGYGDIYNKMVVGIQGGALPSLVVAYQNQAMAYYRDEGVVDLTPYMDSPKWGLSQARQPLRLGQFGGACQRRHLTGSETNQPFRHLPARR